jgi:hypothetical protein
MAQPYNQPSAVPTTKVQAGFNWGVVTILLAYFAKLAWGVDFPDEVDMSLTVIISGLAAYFTRERS